MMVLAVRRRMHLGVYVVKREIRIKSSLQRKTGGELKTTSVSEAVSLPEFFSFT